MILFFPTVQLLAIVPVSVWKNQAKNLAALKDKYLLGDISGYVYVMVTHWFYSEMSAKFMNVMLAFSIPAVLLS